MLKIFFWSAVAVIAMTGVAMAVTGSIEVQTPNVQVRVGNQPAPEPAPPVRVVEKKVIVKETIVEKEDHDNGRHKGHDKHKKHKKEKRHDHDD